MIPLYCDMNGGKYQRKRLLNHFCSIKHVIWKQKSYFSFFINNFEGELSGKNKNKVRIMKRVKKVDRTNIKI